MHTKFLHNVVCLECYGMLLDLLSILCLCSGKITGMLLEIDNSDLVHMLEDQTSLKGKVIVGNFYFHLIFFYRSTLTPYWEKSGNKII